MADTLVTRAAAASDPAIGAVAISYGGGDQNLTGFVRGLYITTAGNLNVVFADGSNVTLTGLLAGTVYPFCLTQIKQSSSTAAGFVLI